MIVLVIPVAALVLALVWVRWARAPDKPLDEGAQIAAHHRRLEALAPDHSDPDGSEPPATAGLRLLPRTDSRP